MNDVTRSTIHAYVHVALSICSILSDVLEEVNDVLRSRRSVV
jgi:hypothetical protein